MVLIPAGEGFLVSDTYDEDSITFTFPEAMAACVSSFFRDVS